jgi:hypothetical protein
MIVTVTVLYQFAEVRNVSDDKPHQKRNHDGAFHAENLTSPLLGDLFWGLAPCLVMAMGVAFGIIWVLVHFW